jgi:hypothetical protein
MVMVLWHLAMSTYPSTRDVCQQIGLTEPALRHVLRRAGAPRPQLHPSARLFLWTQEDIDALKRFLSPEQDPQQQEARNES